MTEKFEEEKNKCWYAEVEVKEEWETIRGQASPLLYKTRQGKFLKQHAAYYAGGGLARESVRAKGQKEYEPR